MIEVRKLNETTFEVGVSGRTQTRHTVTVDPDDYARLSGGRVSAETLVAKSFEFLLDREPNTSILSRFNLMEIARYFPEYEATIRSMVK